MPSDIRIHLELEKSRMQREKAKFVMDKSLALYVLFMIVAVVGFVFGYFDSTMLNALIVIGIAVLLLGAIPYVLVIHREEKRIDELLR